MKTKNIYLLLIFLGLSILLVLVVQRNQTAAADRRAEQIINAYIQAKGLDIQPGTEAYTSFLGSIYRGEHPDLTGESSAFIQSRADLDSVINYAARHMNESGNQGQEPDAEGSNA